MGIVAKSSPKALLEAMAAGRRRFHDWPVQYPFILFLMLRMLLTSIRDEVDADPDKMDDQQNNYAKDEFETSGET